jgi:hypothetical protein
LSQRSLVSPMETVLYAPSGPPLIAGNHLLVHDEGHCRGLFRGLRLCPHGEGSPGAIRMLIILNIIIDFPPVSFVLPLLWQNAAKTGHLTGV